MYLEMKLASRHLYAVLKKKKNNASFSRGVIWYGERWYRKSGNFRVIKFSCFKYSCKNIFVVRTTHENFLTVHWFWKSDRFIPRFTDRKRTCQEARHGRLYCWKSLLHLQLPRTCIKKYSSTCTSCVVIGQVKNGYLYLRYGSSSEKTTAKCDKTVTDKKPWLYNCKKFHRSSATPLRSREKKTWKFQFCYPSFFFLFITPNSKTIECIWMFYM